MRKDHPVAAQHVVGIEFGGEHNVHIGQVAHALGHIAGCGSNHNEHLAGGANGGQGSSSGGQRDMVPVLARAAVAVGVAGLFMETHPKPAEAWSDGPNAVPLGKMKALLETLVELDTVTKRHPFLEDDFS